MSGGASGCPVHAEGGTAYEQYMNTDLLLSLQKPADEMLHHDELMFQTVHQSFELWCKLVRFELKSVGRLLDEGRIVETYPLLQRCIDAMRLQSEAMHVLETMTPLDFHEIRKGLGDGSGSESPGFKGIMADAPLLWPRVEKLLTERDLTLKQAYIDRAEHPELVQLLERLTDFDMFFHVWRQNHLAMVKRVIGYHVKSLKGYEVEKLQDDVQMVLWPPLWKVREELTVHAGTGPATSLGA